MKKWVVLGIALSIAASLQAENNETNTSATVNTTTKAQLSKHVEEQLKREETFAKTQEFKQGDDYNLTEHQVDPKDLENIKVLEPYYDFNMDDVYD